jgi:hypothetical protein
MISPTSFKNFSVIGKDPAKCAERGRTRQLKRAGDEIGTHMAEVCERGLLARLGLRRGPAGTRHQLHKGHAAKGPASVVGPAHCTWAGLGVCGFLPRSRQSFSLTSMP